jgi:hypothetical protein
VRSTWGVLVLLAGCGRIAFDATVDASGDAVDVVDAPPLRACPWTSNPTLGAVVFHSELSGIRQEADPQLVRGDPLTMYFARDIGGPQFDIFVARRPSVGAMFQPPQPVAELAVTTQMEFALQVDTTGHGHYVRGASLGTTDIYEVQSGINGVFADVRKVAELDNGAAEYDPFVTADGTSMWFTAGSANNQDIFTASRATTTSTWGSPISFVHNTAGPDGGASLTDDGLLVVWSSAAMTTVPSDIYFATRATTAEPWGPAQVLGPGTISGTTHDLEPGIRGDGCELFFARSPAPSDGNWDVYSVTLQ